MLRNKGKILFTLMLILVVGVLFATATFAVEGKDITIQFLTSGNALDKNINTSQIVQGEAQILGGNTLRLPTKDVATGSSFNWRSEDGRCWEGGSTVTFYESTKLYPVTAIDITTAEEMYTYMPKGSSVRLLNDIYLDKKPDFPWPGTCTVILNGKTLELNSSLGDAWGGQRCGTFFYGTGTVKYAGSGTFMNLQGHGWGGDSCRLFVGAGVTIDAPNATLGRDGDGSYVQGYPWIQIYGIVNCTTVLKMQNSGNRNPRIEVYDGAQLNISGPLITHTATGNTVRVNILGGNITTKGSVSFFQDLKAEFTITGGFFDFANSDDYDELKNKISLAQYKIIELTGSNEKVYKTVVSYSVCNHEYELHSTIDANCSTCTRDCFVCKNCETLIRISYGTFGAHAFGETPLATKQPTKTTVGWDKYVCPDCASIKLEYIYYDPTNDPVTVVVKTDTGTKEVAVPLKDIYVVDSTFTVTGIKAFGDYTIDQIVGITIPVGISNININTVNSSVTTLTLGEGLVADIISLKGLTKLENIVIKNVAGVIFEKDCAPKTVKSIKSDVSGANVEYAEQAFYQHTNLTEMTFSKNSIYKFGKQSFRESGVLSLNFVDGCNVTFSGEQAFYASKVEYLYVGKGITTIPNKPFDNAYYLQKVILMDVTSISDNAFTYMNKGASPCEVYHHAASLSVSGGTFKESHGIIVYTKVALTQGFNNCKGVTLGGVTYPAYTIHYGITHAYQRIEKDPTCLAEGSVKYVTTCPCGKNEGTSHKVFHGEATSSSTYTVEDFSDKIKEKLPHDLSSVGKISYSDGYTRYGYYTYTCSMCNKGIEEEIASCPPLISTYGYSVSTAGDTSSMSVKYVVDEAMLAKYQASNGITLDYGTVVAVKKQLGDQTPLDNSGNARNGVIKNKTLGYLTNEIKLVNLQEAHKNISYVMSIYIIDNGQITYIQDTETVENPSGVTYKEVNELLEYYASLSLTTPPTKTKEN